MVCIVNNIPSTLVLVEICIEICLLYFFNHILHSLGLKADIPVRLRPVGNNIFAATYSPKTPGTYLLNVLWSGRQVKGCPLKITAESGGDNTIT